MEKSTRMFVNTNGKLVSATKDGAESTVVAILPAYDGQSLTEPWIIRGHIIVKKS